MAAKRSTKVIGGCGVVLMLMAPVVAFVLVPVLTKLPSNTDIKFDYSGTVGMLDPHALEEGAAAHAFVADIPATMHRRIQVSSTTGSTATVEDSLAIEAGSNTIDNEHTYVIDRSTLETVASDDKAAEGSTGCLAAAFPIGPQAKDVYDLYESATQQCFPVHYTGKSKISGREVFNYSLTASGPLKDPHMLESLPPALPKAALESLAPALSEDVQAQFSGALDALPDPVPLNYVVDKTVDAAVDSETGIPLDETLHQQISVQVDTGADQLTLAPVLVVDASVTDDSVDKLSDKAASAGRLLLAFQTIIPLALLVVGLVLVAFAVRRHRKDGRQS